MKRELHTGHLHTPTAPRHMLLCARVVKIKIRIDYSKSRKETNIPKEKVERKV